MLACGWVRVVNGYGVKGIPVMVSRYTPNSLKKTGKEAGSRSDKPSLLIRGAATRVNALFTRSAAAELLNNDKVRPSVGRKYVVGSCKVGGQALTMSP